MSRGFAFSDPANPRLQQFRVEQTFQRAVVVFEFFFRVKRVNLSMAWPTKGHGNFTFAALGHQMMLGQFVPLILMPTDAAYPLGLL